MQTKIKTLKFDLDNERGKFKILNATNGGPWCKRHATDQLRSNFEDYKAVKFPYSRNHDSGVVGVYGGPYSHDISKIFRNFDADENAPESYDFACTDESILCTLDAGTKTFFRLGETIEHQIVKHAVNPPKDPEKWARICEHIIRHYNEGWANGFQLGIEYFEIWNEPNLVPQCWTGTDAQFYDLFSITAKHLKKCFPHLKIGGPAVAGGEPDWVEPFLREMQKREVPLDFFSWHLYAKEPAEIMNRAKEVQALLDKYGYSGVEHNINEWNYNRGWVEDFQYSINAIHGIKAAAFTMATISEGQRTECVDMMMYYDTRPSAFCGVFDYYSYEKLKSYYPLYWYGQYYYDLENYIPQKNSVKNFYSLCGTDKDGKITCIVTHYSENDNTKPKKIKLDFGRKARFEAFIVDADNDAKKIKIPANLEIEMPVHSFILLKEI